MKQFKAIVLLGAGIMQIPMMFSIKRRGYAVIACDANARAIGRRYCDTFWNIDISKSNDIVTKIHESKYLVQGVLTTATDFSYSVAKIAKACNLKGLDPTTARNFVFKNNMREVLAAATIAIPKFSLLDELSFKEKHYDTIATSIGYPLVVKPIDNMGARGVQKVYSHEYLHAMIYRSLLYTKKHMLILEQMLDGPELSIDALMYGDALYSLGIADRHVYFSPYCIELGHSMPSVLNTQMIKEACKLMQEAALALGMREGICKADIIFHKGKPYIGELAARLSGGYMSGWTSPHYFGENINDIAISLILDETMAMDTIQKIHNCVSNTDEVHVNKTVKSMPLNTSTGERSLLSLPGIIVAIKASASIHRCILQSKRFPQQNNKSIQKEYTIKNKQSKVFAIYMHKNIGDMSCFPKNNTEKTASLLIKANHVSAIDSIAAKNIVDIFVDIKINKHANFFLYSMQDEQRCSPWRCFPLDDNLLHLEQGVFKTQNMNPKQKHALLLFLQTSDIRRLFTLCIVDKEQFRFFATTCFGSWTFCNLYETVRMAHEKKIIIIDDTASQALLREHCSDEANMFQSILWRAIFRAGWQGIYYTRKLIQQCPQEIIQFV